MELEHLSTFHNILNIFLDDLISHTVSILKQLREPNKLFIYMK